MERAETLTRLRGDNNIVSTEGSKLPEDWKNNAERTTGESIWRDQASRRFPDYFIKSAPENAQRMILWCLDRAPSHRPSAEALLSVGCPAFALS